MNSRDIMSAAILNLGGPPVIRAEPTFQVTVYVGGREGYDGPLFTKGTLMDAINVYQKFAPEDERGCVTVTETTYKFGDYEEPGYAIGIINYPRFPLRVEKLSLFALQLGTHLLAQLKQNRISVVMPSQTVLLERPDPEENPRGTTTGNASVPAERRDAGTAD
jgi:hypothetical protein